MCKETEKKEIFESLTIVIFSKNREDELRNLIEYLEPYKPRILLLDGTPGGYQRISLRSDSTHVLGSSIAKRAEFASNYLTTEFAALLSDDDLLDMSGVSSAIQYLKSNKAVGCVFSVRNFSDYYVEKRINFRKYNLLKESPQERLVDWAKTGSEFYWRGVWRSEDLRKVLKFLGEALKTFSEDTALHGPLVSLYGSSLSKLKFIDKDLYLSRSWGPKIDTSMLKVSLRESRNQFGIEESEMEKLPIFLNILAAQLSPIFNLPVSDTLDRVNSSLKRYQEYIIRSREPSFLNQCVAIIRGKILQEYVNLFKESKSKFFTRNFFKLAVSIIYIKVIVFSPRRQKAAKFFGSQKYSLLCNLNLLKKPNSKRELERLAIVDTECYLKLLNVIESRESKCS